MVKIVLDAGHGLNTPGKRTPAGEPEWSFNDKVVRAAIAMLNGYENVEILRVDDPTGKIDVPLEIRTDKANAFKADVYIACHHNANTGSWGTWTGTEIYTYNHPQTDPKSVEIVKVIHPLVIRAMGLKDRGLKKENFHVLRETKMPSLLIEGGFMDSTIDIVALRNDAKLHAQGVAIAEGLIKYFGLKEVKNEEPKIDDNTELFNTGSQSLNSEFIQMLVKARQKGLLTDLWEKRAAEGKLTESEAISLIAIVIKRALLDD